MNEKGKSTLDICRQKLKYFNYSDNTIDLYIGYIDKFLKSQNKSSIHINSKDYSDYLLNYNFTSTSQQNQIISSLKFLYNKILLRKYNKVDFQRPKKNKKLPIVLSKEEVQRMFDVCENLKHRVILAILYSTGIRSEELISLKWSHVDRSRMIINIIGGKGKKDRQVGLSKSIIPLLENYWREYKSQEYILNGQFPKINLKYSKTSVRNVLKQLAERAGINKNVYTHLMRHNCFTHMVENGVDINLIQRLAGHSNVKTTAIYTHISHNIISKIHSPIDCINMNKKYF